jgi:predicted dehydrogenase
LRILVAGGGAFGKEHLKTLTAIGGVSLAVAEPRADERERLNALFALADSDADAVTLIDRFAPDGVVVATPADAHAPLAVAALERQIPVLVEKPVASDTATMRDLCGAAAASNAFLLPGHVLRFSSAHAQLRDILRSGEIGHAVQFISRRYRDASHAQRYADIDPVMMTMIHDIDLAVWFTGGGALSARAVRNPVGRSRSITTAWLEGAQGIVWQLSTAWLHPGPDCPPDRVEIIGTKGSAELVAGSRIDVFGDTHRRVAINVEDDPLRSELECFLSGIRGGKAPAQVSPDDALQGLIAAEMIVGALDRR